MNMERPDLKRMLKAIERKQIDVVVTKDLSRLGRNYLQTGYLIEEFFPKNNVRYIALLDGVDTDKENNEITPIKCVINEFYSRDISKKIHSSYVSKARNGKFTGCIAPFGYRKDPTDKNKLLIDDETAWIVKEIFEYARNGNGANYIRRKLEDREIPTPCYFNRIRGLRNKVSKFEIQDPERGKFIWGFSTIKEIISNPVYIGSIASQKTVYKFKTGWIKDKKPSEWIIVENVHEPIIKKDVFQLVQEKVTSRKRADAFGNFSIFAGLIKCGQCESSMNIRRANTKTNEKIYTCSKYNKFGVAHCSQHRMKYDVIYNIILEQICSYGKKALADEDTIVKELQDSLQATQSNQHTIIEQGIAIDNERIATLDRLIGKLYEDMISEKISEDNFNRLLEKSQSEQEMLKKRVSLNTERLNEKVQTMQDNSKWLKMIKEYADIKELDSVILNRLIKKIVVHEDRDNGVIKQTVEIYFNFMEQSDKYKLIRQ